MTSAAGPPTVVLVDDHALFRSGVRAELAGRCDVLAEAEDVDGAVDAILGHAPDVVLLDVHLPGGGGVAVVERVLAERPGQAFLALSVKLLDGVPLPATGTAHRADQAGAFVLTSTIALSLSLSWAPYASDFSRYLPRSASRPRMFWYTLLGMVAAYLWVQTLGLWAAKLLTDQTAAGVRTLLGGGWLGAFGLLAIAVSAVCSNAMHDYSGSLALQTAGVRIPRPLAAAVAAALGFVLVLWMHAADTTARFQNVLLFVGYWIPGFVGVVAVDWYARTRGRGGEPLDLRAEFARPQPWWPATVAFAAAFAAAVPFMDTTVYTGPVATALHGGDLAYYVAFAVSVAVYAPLRLRRRNA